MGVSLLVENNRVDKGHQRSDTAGINLTAAATIVFLHEYYRVHLDVPVISNLCTTLLPDINTKQTCLKDLEELKKNFSGLERYGQFFIIFLFLLTYNHV